MYISKSSLEIWAFRNSYNFFERLLWLVSSGVLNGSCKLILSFVHTFLVNFLNNSAQKLKLHPEDLRISGPESFTLFDLKVSLGCRKILLYF